MSVLSKKELSQGHAAADIDASWLKVRVDEIHSAGAGLKHFVLRPVEGRNVSPIQAGSHIKVLAGDSRRPVMRSYSLVNPGERPEGYEIVVQYEPDGQGGSAWMHESVRKGDILRVSEPRNDFALDGKASKYLFIAGGIGITPIYSMVQAVAGANSRPDYALHYCGRSVERMAFAQELKTLCRDRLTLVVDGGNADKGLDLQAMLAQPEPGAQVYVCGPRGLIDACIETALKNGWPRSALHFELFSGNAIQADNKIFEVVLQSSGLALTVPVHKSILEVIEEAGVFVISDCRRGECGACAATVLEGVPEHRDIYLDEDEKNSATVLCTCVSRSRTARLVLDL